jgi:hypothetical protein
MPTGTHLTHIVINFVVYEKMDILFHVNQGAALVDALVRIKVYTHVNHTHLDTCILRV